MSTSTALDQQVTEEQERHDLLEKLHAHKIVVDENTSLGAAEENAQIERKRENEEATPAERELETEQPASDEVEKQEVPKPDPEGKRLFDESDYEREDLAIPKIDGNQIDRIAIRFAGEVFLDRSSPEDVALFNKLKLGHDVTLMVEAKCSSTGAKGATDREGDLDVTVGQRAVKVHTVYIPAGDAATV